MSKLINAPNLKKIIKQNIHPAQEILILIGDNPWSFYRKNPKDEKTNGQGSGWMLLADNIDGENPNRYKELPIIIDERNYKELDKLALLPNEHKSASLVDTSGLFKVKSNNNGITIRENEELLRNICINLAKYTQVNAFSLRDLLGQHLEDLSTYIERLRDEYSQESEGEPELIELDADTLKKATPSDKAGYFLKWLKKPLAYNQTQGLIYFYNGQIWQVKDENALQREIKKFFAEYKSNYGSVETINNMIKCLTVDLPLFDDEIKAAMDYQFLAFKNGVLNKRTLAFLPHKKEYYLTAINPCDYLETQTPTPNFDKWLDFISNDSIERKKALLAALYMILNNRSDWQLTLEFIGEPGSGKSTFLNVAKMLSGDANHVAIDLETLQRDSKTRDMLLNKTFLYAPDQGRYIGESSVLKAISGGDEILVNPKGKKTFSVRINAIIAICSNTLPIYKNDGGGMERRRVVFPFYKAIDDSARDDKLTEKIQAELGGIIRKLYDEFKDPEDAKQALKQQKASAEALKMKTENDHILEFIQEFELISQPSNDCLILGSSRGIPAYESPLIFERFYWCYLYYCYITGREGKFILKPVEFKKEVIQAFKTIGEKPFTARQLGGGYNYTNAKFKNKHETVNKWRNA
ncbi:DNA primase [Histophilus somni]|uniref:DNA primase n=1 Tax=Histophilus somni TaxID=731 RepID=A0A9Q6K6S9_HISSO|nr:phage/plasmid primase, P4 family [Histophilus somni]ARU64612.1 DNA primase [Histophilus somni]ARU66478.1 DNA primase [Histophilus somni]ARU68352.1 DNA primase [Histophilus somni]ARU70230.1 DNA primase [Histophilus somni]ARU72106.1 DNA primase [Histophilus somni]